MKRDSQEFKFEIKAKAKKSYARAGLLKTRSGSIKTPVFMPVGSSASVKSLSPDDLKDLGAQIVLANTYHLYLRPGYRLIKKLGGLHKFMGWNRPILTDSGGYQVSSLGHFIDDMGEKHKRVFRSTIDDMGVLFKSHLDGTSHRFTPEKSIEIQKNLGADIIMAFDEATPNKGRKYAGEAMNRTHKWLLRSIEQWRTKREKRKEVEGGQVLFGIIQGGNYKDLRRQSAEFVVGQNLPGIAIGGGSIGQDPEETEKNLDWIRSLLPERKPIYLMGVGVSAEDIISVIKSGADMFDCVAPTRLARMGSLYHGKLRRSDGKWKFKSEFNKGRMNIANKRFKFEGEILQENCDCYTCKSGFSRAYLHHLFKARELLYYRLASIHNVRLVTRLVEDLREDIIEEG
jgi:queuine tRNA-ribosyltransferase